MSRWESRRDELERTVFEGQLDIEGGEQETTMVTPKKTALRPGLCEGSGRSASSCQDQFDFSDE